MEQTLKCYWELKIFKTSEFQLLILFKFRWKGKNLLMNWIDIINSWGTKLNWLCFWNLHEFIIFVVIFKKLIYPKFALLIPYYGSYGKDQWISSSSFFFMKSRFYVDIGIVFFFFLGHLTDVNGRIMFFFPFLW